MAKLPTQGRAAMRPSASDLAAQLAHLASMSVDELRAAWSGKHKRSAPPALTRDLLARALAHEVQAEVFGGLDPRVKKILAGVATSDAPPARRVKVGSIIAREYQGRLHEVLVVPDGFCWQGQVFASLSTIARKITGTSWNGPRFFGLRGKEKAAPDDISPQSGAPREPVSSRRGSVAAVSGRRSIGGRT